MKKTISIPFLDILNLPAMTIATVGLDKNPHAATVYFSADKKVNLYFLSAKHSQHIQDLMTNPLAAVTIFPLVSKWQMIRGLQMRGVVNEVEGGVYKLKEYGHFALKFPDIKDLNIEVLKNRLYVFKPVWIRLIDNQKEFGNKQEWFGNALGLLLNQA